MLKGRWLKLALRERVGSRSSRAPREETQEAVGLSRPSSPPEDLARADLPAAYGSCIGFPLKMPGEVLAHRAEIAVGIDAADKAVPLPELAERKKAYALLLKARVDDVSSGKKA